MLWAPQVSVHPSHTDASVCVTQTVARFCDLLCHKVADPVRSFSSCDVIHTNCPCVAAQARAKSAQLGLSNVEWLHGNIEEASFPPASFDIITCSAAMPFVRHIPAALEAWKGWLRPGGRLAFNSWRAPPGAMVDYGTFIQVGPWERRGSGP